MNEMSALSYKRDTRELTCPFYHMRTREHGSSPELNYASVVILDFLGSETVRT